MSTATTQRGDRHLAQPEHGPYYIMEEVELVDGTTAKWKTEPAKVFVEGGVKESSSSRDDDNNHGDFGRKRSRSAGRCRGRSKTRGRGRGGSTDVLTAAGLQGQRPGDGDRNEERSGSQESLVEQDGIRVKKEVVIS